MSIPLVDGRRFMLGKYEVIARPIPHSTHMLRYTVFVKGIRIGAMASMPSESDCQFLESPPEVPPLVPYQSYYRPGRPKKGAPPRAALDIQAPREEIPHGLSIPRSAEEH